MTKEVKVVQHISEVPGIAKLLQTCQHMSFPVCDEKGYCGIINRIDLVQLLLHPEIFQIWDQKLILKV